ncbi:MAG TPA: carboxypeptidase-like regulatory domain-containing protein [Candidatus Acidoferrum sp.]
MRKRALFVFSFLVSSFLLASAAAAQTSTGSLEFIARITPTAARPEPVRQFTFYILTKSYTAIVKEAEEKDPIPARDAFIDTLTVSPELRAWLKSHDTLDLTSPDLDKLLTPDDLIHVPEFLLAYQRSNSGGVTSGLPKPKYKESDRTEHPEKYEKLRQDYLNALTKFIRSHPETVSGVELELDGVNPQRKWAAIQNDRRKRVLRAAPDLAQLKFLAARGDTDLEGHAFVSNLPPGDYWISTLNLEANAGDMRVHWDVPVRIEAGQTTRVELTNLNTTEASSPNP